MCLTRIIEKHEPPLGETRVGYKVFEIYKGEARFQFEDLNGSRLVPLGKELKADIARTITFGIGDLYRSRFAEYKSGFHIFKHLRHARDHREWYFFYLREEMAIFKVRYRNISCAGKQLYRNLELDVDVAEYMTVDKNWRFE